MGESAAKQGDRITGTDDHMIQPPGSAPPTSIPHPFAGVIDSGLSTNVRIEKRPAATMGSTATNLPPHVPQGGTFVNPPTNQGKIASGSKSVNINGKAAARNGDSAETCADPIPNQNASVVASGTVSIGD